MGDIDGGIVLGSGDTIYFASRSGNSSTVHSRTASGAARWQWAAGSKVFCPPSVNASGSQLFVATDQGVLYCLNTDPAAPQRIAWRYPAAGSTLTQPIRNTPVFDGTHPSGPTVYFQGNDGKLYALNANTGTPRWASPATTGNTQPTPALGTFGTPPLPFHPDPWSCSPVLDHQNRVVVGTSGGLVCAFNRVTGALEKEVNLRSHLQNNTVEIEAALAIAPNGWIYAGTRRFQHGSPAANRQVLAAVDFAQSPGFQIRWTANIPSDDHNPGSPGIISGVLADRMGYVYVTEYGHRFVVVNGGNGAIVSHWTQQSLSGKLCATPSLTEDGIAIVPMSDQWSDGLNAWGVAAIRICDSNDSPLLWNWVPAVSGSQALNFVGSPAIRADGRIIIGDSVGRLWRINAPTRLMLSAWPSLQGANSRAGVGKPVTTIIEELPALVGGDPAYNTAVRIDQAGRALGLGHGQPYPYSGSVAQYGAVWEYGQIKLASQAPPDYGLNQRVVGGNQLGWFAGGSGTNRMSVWVNGVPGTPTYLQLPTGFTGFGGGPFITGACDYGLICGYGTDSQSGNFTRAAWWELVSGTWVATKVLFFTPGNVVVNGASSKGRIFGKAQFTVGGPYQGFLSDAFPIFINSDSAFMAVTGSSEVLESSDQGGTVGWTDTGGGMRAFRVPAGVQTPVTLSSHLLSGLGLGHSSAWGINCDGQAVGRSQLPNQSEYRAVRWDRGVSVAQDLNSLLPPNSGWVLEHAISISDQGVVLGSGRRNGAQRLWRMRPQ
ncbi:MAG: PQQ-binding-like beta-propeller repeat protein [Verrucomicrobiae bacterium]|nr:PQQ-binding-like beta-propeller repeat protein [Verrucomicrobiae bacterium]